MNSPPTLGPIASDADFSPVAPTLKIVLITLGDPATMTGGYLYHRRMAAWAGQNNAAIRFVSFPPWPFPLAIFAAPSVFRRVHRLRPRAIVIDSIAAAYAGPWLGLRGSRLAVIGMLHQPPGGIDYGPLRTRLQAWLDMLAYRRACRLLVASESLADELAALGVPRSKMAVVPPGRDVAGIGESRAPELRHGRRAAFLCVGNWVERKGIHSLLEAFAALQPELATLHLVGDDKVDERYSAMLRARIDRPDLKDRVVVHGPLPPGKMAAFYRSADVFVLPSMKEPYGTVYGEAMAEGLPVVGWMAGNLPYLADDGQEGLMVRPGDVRKLAQALERLALDETLRRQMGEAARRRAMARPTWEESARLFFGAVREVARERSIP